MSLSSAVIGIYMVGLVILGGGTFGAYRLAIRRESWDLYGLSRVLAVALVGWLLLGFFLFLFVANGAFP